MLPALVLLAVPSLVVEIEAPKSVQSGEPFHVVARLVNRSDAPVTLVRPEVPLFELGVGFGGGLYREGHRMPTTLGGRSVGQWMLPDRFGPGCFSTLAPGEGVPIEDIVYRQVYTKPFSGLIRDLETTPKGDLAPGEYTLRFSYGFRPEFHIKREARSGSKPGLTPEGRALYRKAWTGQIEGTANLTVSAA